MEYHWPLRRRNGPFWLGEQNSDTLAQSTTQTASNCELIGSINSVPTPQSRALLITSSQKQKFDDNEIQLNSALQSYVEVWNSLIVENGLLRHVNGSRHSSCVAVFLNLRKGVVSALHLPAHHGFKSTLRRVAQRFWWPRVRGDVSTYVRNCDVCDGDRNSNPNPRAALKRLPAD